MIVVRLARGGAKKHPFYHIVVTDSRRRRDSGYLERLGYFNPFAVKDETPVLLNWERFDYWISKGAKSSPRVSSIISKLERKEPQKTDTNTTKSPEATEAENEPPPETEAAARVNLQSEESKTTAESKDKPESAPEEKQANSTKTEANPEDVDDTPNAETSAANKKADNE